MLKRNISSIVYVVIIIIIALFILKQCDNNIDNNQNNGGNDTLVIYKTDTLRDTIFSIDTVTVISKPVITIIEVPFYIDTNKVLKDYYIIREYTDTLVNDSDLVIVTKETIQHNKLKSIIVSHKNMRPTVINNTKYIITPEENHIYVGGFLNGSNDFLDYGGQVIYTKKNWAYNAGFGFNNKALYIGVNYKIK